MAISQVQKAGYASSASSTTHDFVFSTPPVQGNLLILCASADDDIQTPAGWSVAISNNGWTHTLLIYKIAGASEPTTIQLTLDASTSLVVEGFEYSGITTVTPLDKTATANGTNASAESGTTAAISQDAELCMALVGVSIGSTTISAWSNGFAQEASLVATGSGVNIRGGTASKIVNSVAAQSTVATLSGSTTWEGGIATFSAATAGANLVPRLTMVRRMLSNITAILAGIFIGV